jgi:hypothetical protein
MIVLASQNPMFGAKFSKRAQKGRDVFETPRRNFSKDVSKDIKRIVDDEVSFSKALLKHMVPVTISIDKNATGLKKLIPIDISLDEGEDAPEVKVVVEDKDYKDYKDYNDGKNAAILHDE